MKRHVLNVATASSVLLLAAVVTLWVRSYWVADELTLKRTKYIYSPSDSRYLEEPTWIGRISVDCFQSNRGLVGNCHRQSVDQTFLDAKSVKVWSEDYPPGRFLLWDRDEPTDFLYYDNFGVGRGILHSKVLLNRLGFFIETHQAEGLAAGDILGFAQKPRHIGTLHKESMGCTKRSMLPGLLTVIAID